jgi:hypothetical protein
VSTGEEFFIVPTHLQEADIPLAVDISQFEALPPKYENVQMSLQLCAESLFQGKAKPTARFPSFHVASGFS